MAARLPHEFTAIDPAVRREIVDLEPADGWPGGAGVLYRPPRQDPDVVVLAMHPRVDFFRHYLAPALVAAGYAFVGAPTRYLNHDADALHERLLLDVAGTIRALRERGFARVILLGNSGGGSLLAFYLEQAGTEPAARLERAPSGDRVPLRELELPPADGLILLAAHLGEGKFLLDRLDPSVIDEANPTAVNSRLDMYDPANGYRPMAEGPSRYAAGFLAEFRAAQRARCERLDRLALEWCEEAAYFRAKLGAAEPAERPRLARYALQRRYLLVYRTLADPRYLDPTLDPSERPLGSIFSFGRDPVVGNYGDGLARAMSARGWLSTWSGLRSNAALERCPPSPCRRSSSPPAPTWTSTRRSAGARSRRAGRATGPTGSSRGRVTTSIRWARKGRSFPTRASAWPTNGSCRGSAATGRSDRRVMPAAAAERALARLTIGHYMLRRWSLEEDVRHLERLGFRSISLASTKFDAYGPARAIRLLRASSLRVAHLGSYGRFGTERQTIRRGIDRVRRAIEHLHQLGGDALFVLSGGREGTSWERAAGVYRDAYAALLPEATAHPSRDRGDSSPPPGSFVHQHARRRVGDRAYRRSAGRLRPRLLPLGLGAASPRHDPPRRPPPHPRRPDVRLQAGHHADDGPRAPRQGHPAAAGDLPCSRAGRLPRLVRGRDHLRRPRGNGLRARAPPDAGGVRPAAHLNAEAAALPSVRTRRCWKSQRPSTCTSRSRYRPQ